MARGDVSELQLNGLFVNWPVHARACARDSPWGSRRACAFRIHEPLSRPPRTRTPSRPPGLSVGSLGFVINGLAEQLRANRSVTCVDMSENRLGLQCGHALGEMLKHNGTIERLELGHNSLGPVPEKEWGEQGAGNILQALATNRGLSRCWRRATPSLHALVLYVPRRPRLCLGCL